MKISYRRYKMAFCQDDKILWESTGAVTSGEGACDPETSPTRWLVAPHVLSYRKDSFRNVRTAG